jgi:hypothetical protein
VITAVEPAIAGFRKLGAPNVGLLPALFALQFATMMILWRARKDSIQPSGRAGCPRAGLQRGLNARIVNLSLYFNDVWRN